MSETLLKMVLWIINVAKLLDLVVLDLGGADSNSYICWVVLSLTTIHCMLHANQVLYVKS